MESTKTKGYKDLIVWKKSYKLALEIYRLTKDFPKDEMYGLVQQMRRCAVSIPSNIAEGYGRQHGKEYKQFLAVALGSVSELETQYSLAVDLGYAKEGSELRGLLKECGAMLYRMINPVSSFRVSPIRYPLESETRE